MSNIKQFYKTISGQILFVFVLLLSSFSVKSQTTLNPGDMAFLSLKVSGDGFAFVTFVDICPRTVIYFTDNPYRNSGGFCTSREEFCISLTVTTTIPAGTQITYTDGAPGTFTIPSGAGTIAWAFNSEAGQNNGFSSSGDNCFAFQGTYLNPSFICGIKTSAYTASGSVNCTDRAHTELPSTLTLGTSALFRNVGSSDGIYYSCSTTSGTTAALKSAINNSANWTAGTNPITVPCSFTVTDAVAATCTVTCSCNIWSEDFNTTRYPARTTTGANSNTANPAADWTTTATDCDDGTPFATLNQSYWGTDAGTFKCNDVEGPCGSCSPGGTTLNEWITESIDISMYVNISVCVSFANSGTMELNNSTSSCNNADDIIQGQYSINGGPWISWFFDDGSVNLSPATVSGLNGNTLQLRINVGNKANDEFYTFDNVCVSGLSVLPVEFTDFSVSPMEDAQALLSWTTASETNNNYFQVERSFDARTWTSIGLVSGNGTTSQPHSYSFVDAGPLSTQTYYRLKQVDFDGQFAITPIRVLLPETQNAIAISPNPSNDFFTVNGLKEDITTKVYLYNCSGQIVQEYETDQALLVIPAYALQPGIYFAEVVCGDRVERFRLVRAQE